MIKVTIWNEFRHEKTKEEVKALYPDGLHKLIGSFLSENDDLFIRYAALDDEYQGLPDEVLNDTDVLIWWGHMHHGEVDDALADRIRDRVYLGKMGFIALHSAHKSKPFQKILGTNGNLSWGRNQREVIWNMDPTHPICAGIPDHFTLESEELYSEPFYLPKPDSLLFVSWYEDGNVFKGGATFTRGLGKIFYFQPGHETCRSFFNPYVRKIITNAVYWAAPTEMSFEVSDACPHLLTKVTDEFDK